MRRPLFLLLLAAACVEDDPQVLETLRARRIALGLEAGRLPLDEAMGRIEKAGYEDMLAKAKLGLDDALRLENLLVRARPGDIPEGMLHRSRRLISEYVHAAAAGEPSNLGPLIRSCVDCHIKFRE